MKAVYQNKPLKSRHFKSWFSSKWDWLKSRDGKEAFTTLTTLLTILLFMYTAVSKLLEYDKFVFQMRLAPLPLMQSWASVIGRIVPIVELALVVLLFVDRMRYWGLICSLMLMVLFEIYIIWMKIMEIQTSLRLPCTCGGIVSKKGWATHLLFNAVFIFLLGLSIYYEWKKRKLKIV